jgi:hypothetical protein
MDFLVWVENWPFSIWVRESGTLLAYPTILFLHTVGLSIVVGISAAIALRVLGVARAIPLPPLASFYRLLWAGFWVNALSGAALLAADATTKLTNPVFYIKMACVALAMFATVRLRRSLSARLNQVGAREPGRFLAAASLALWVGAVTAGRLMAYIGPVSGAPGLTNKFGR